MNYRNGKIFYVVNELGKIIKIGYTTISLNKYLYKYRHKYINCYIYLITNHSCNNKAELKLKCNQIKYCVYRFKKINY